MAFRLNPRSGFQGWNEMREKTMKIGVMSREAFKSRTVDIAKGMIKPGKDEPKVWFESLKSMAQVLGGDNQELLRIIHERMPESLAELEALTGRKRGNLSRTLHTMARYGIVDLRKADRKVKPVVNATRFQVQFGIYDAPVVPSPPGP